MNYQLHASVRRLESCFIVEPRKEYPGNFMALDRPIRFKPARCNDNIQLALLHRLHPHNTKVSNTLDLNIDKFQHTITPQLQHNNHPNTSGNKCTHSPNTNITHPSITRSCRCRSRTRSCTRTAYIRRNKRSRLLHNRSLHTCPRTSTHCTRQS